MTDEAWRALGVAREAEAAQERTNLSRDHNVSSIYLVHKLADLKTSGDEGSRVRQITENLVADCATRVIYSRRPNAQPHPQLASIRAGRPLRGRANIACMDDLYPPTPLDVVAMEAVCSESVNGWLWYCDQHDTHGNADSQDEVEHMADAHVEFFLEDGDDPCAVMTWFRTPHERASQA